MIASWQHKLKDDLNAPYMRELRTFLQTRLAAGARIFPPGNQYFAALDHTPVESIKVVIIGQDPYHGLGQAHGLCFSVQRGVAIPPSLQNIYKELKNDLGIAPANHGDLTAWADQGVLLLNAVLTVEEGRAGAHANKGWEKFTDRIISIVNNDCPHVAFILWGAYAQKKGQSIDAKKHLVLQSPHPSPLSASRGFFGSRPFSRVNAWLLSKGISPVDWRLETKANQEPV